MQSIHEKLKLSWYLVQCINCLQRITVRPRQDEHQETGAHGEYLSCSPLLSSRLSSACRGLTATKRAWHVDGHHPDQLDNIRAKLRRKSEQNQSVE
mmetsp:Transcript_94535/g.138033  ORF Transcript_94535/g.138033 Transcript_94535/m.138033 type:complete len:96 (+) Transcript_94535:206-493(+)